MMKHILMALALTFAGICSAYAGSGDLDGDWIIVRDLSKNASIETKNQYGFHIESHGVDFTARYTGINNDSIFKGRVFSARGTKVLQIIQYDSNYVASYSGESVGNGKFRGTWYGVGGESGEFELRRR